MKIKLIVPIGFFTLLGSCGDAETTDAVIDETGTPEATQEIVPADFVNALDASVQEVSEAVKMIDQLDMDDAPEADILVAVDEAVAKAHGLMELIQGYATMQDELGVSLKNKAQDYAGAVTDLCGNGARELAPLFAKPDAEWTDDDMAMFDKLYVGASSDARQLYRDYEALQEEYAAANDVTL